MSKEIDFTRHPCFICGQVCDGQRSLGAHLKWNHPDTSTHDYVLRFILTDGPPKCGCGCGNDTGWHPRKPWFNDYISGHNPTKGISRKVDPEDAKKRNESIRATYSGPNGETIRQKISQAVAKTLNEPDVSQKMSVFNKVQWQDPVKRASMTATRKRVWAERHDELCERIFTPEMRAKISAANRSRNANRRSAAEDLFFATLADRGISCRRGVWIRDDITGMNKCFDGQLEETDELIEFDGVFWHGLDLVEGQDPYEVQLINMENDLHKNALAERLGLGLLRFREGLDMESISDVESLRLLSYLAIDPQ